MNNTYEIPLIVDDQYSHEYLVNLISSLENLEMIKSLVFNKMNQALSERVSKLENLKSRINRALTIITNLENQDTRTTTIISKKYYPIKDHIYNHSLLYDPNAKLTETTPQRICNQNKKNDPAILGTVPKGNIGNAELIQRTYEFTGVIRDVQFTIDKLYKNTSSIRLDEKVEPILNCFNSAFNSFDRSMLIGKKDQPVVDLTEYSNLNNFMFIAKQKQKKRIQDAPDSIINKTKLKTWEKKKNYMNNGINVNINLPTGLKLGNIADFGIENEVNVEQPKNNNVDVAEIDEDEDFYDPSMDNVDEDIKMPLDRIKSRKGVGTGNIITENKVNTTSPQVYTVSTATIQQKVVSAPVGGSIPIPPPLPLTALNIPLAPSIPVIPPSNNQVVVGGKGPGIPLPPPMPIMPTIVQQPKAPTEKKDGPPKEIKAPALTMEEEIKLKMSGLKKVGDTKVEQKVAPKKVEAKTDMISLLRDQINLRFKNLHKHDDEKSDSDSNSDSD